MALCFMRLGLHMSVFVGSKGFGGDGKYSHNMFHLFGPDLVSQYIHRRVLEFTISNQICRLDPHRYFSGDFCGTAGIRRTVPRLNLCSPRDRQMWVERGFSRSMIPSYDVSCIPVM